MTVLYHCFLPGEKLTEPGAIGEIGVNNGQGGGRAGGAAAVGDDENAAAIPLALVGKTIWFHHEYLETTRLQGRRRFP